jgi:hypothetical protein
MDDTRELKLPEAKDIRVLVAETPFASTTGIVLKVIGLHIRGNAFEGLKREIDLREYSLQLIDRIADAAKSFAFMTYFFRQGIPDEPWHISPGKSGNSVDYFPMFEDLHFQIKDWFDFYSDSFFYKAFSSLEMLGQLINVYDRLGLSESDVTFNRVVDLLGGRQHPIYKDLYSLRNSTGYIEANDMRNSATHRVLPSTVGMIVVRKPSGWSMGLRNYISSRIVLERANQIAFVVEAAIKVWVAYIEKDTSEKARS